MIFPDSKMSFVIQWLLCENCASKRGSWISRYISAAPLHKWWRYPGFLHWIPNSILNHGLILSYPIEEWQGPSWGHINNNLESGLQTIRRSIDKKINKYQSNRNIPKTRIYYTPVTHSDSASVTWERRVTLATIIMRAVIGWLIDWLVALLFIIIIR